MRTTGRAALKIIVVFLFAAALIVAAKAAMITMPYRLSYWEGLRFYRWVWIWYAAIAVALGCVAFWMRLVSTVKEKTVGMFGGVAVLLFFFLAHPSWVHSITSAKNLCINQQREIDGAIEQWAELNGKKSGDEVEIAAIGELLKLQKLPECPEGGPYRIGKVGEIPRCAIAEHNLEP
jgi:hypothetical protein